MQAIPININFSFNASKSSPHRRSSAPNSPHRLHNQSSVNKNKKRVLNRLGIGIAIPRSQHSNPKHTKPNTVSNIKLPIKTVTKHSSNHLQTPRKLKNKNPKPNRNFYHKRKTPKTPSRSHHNQTHTHSHSFDNDYTYTPLPIRHTAPNRHTNKSKSNRSPILESKHRKRSHSFSISRTYNDSNLNSKAYHTNRLPTHYSPSITHYTPSIDLDDPNQCHTPDTPEITPPPQLGTTQTQFRTHGHARIQPRKHSRSRSMSHSTRKDKDIPHKNNSHTFDTDCEHFLDNITHNASLNIAHILHLSDMQSEKESKLKREDTSPQTIQINNGKSLLFSSWFGGTNGMDNTVDINERDIDDAIKSIHDLHSDISESEHNTSITKEAQQNPTFTTGLKPPRKYATGKGNGKEEMISFRDFLAQENRHALQREIVNAQNTKVVESKKKKREIRDNIDRFYILKGNSVKVDYGLPEGPYTLYKFHIHYNHKYTRRSKIEMQKLTQHKSQPMSNSLNSGSDININRDYDESPRKKTSHWTIRKRYSDFVTFNNNLITELKEISNKMSKTIKLAKLPPKTFKKNFNETFVNSRHNALLSYLNKIIVIKELQSSITLLTFLGAINNHTLPYNDKFLDSRMTLSVYISNYADTGDVLLFETKSYIAASLRSVTGGSYDHVAFVYRDVDHTHTCTGGNEYKRYKGNLYLIESTVDGVRSYPLKSRLKQWSLLCPQIVVRRLKLLKKGAQARLNKRMSEEWTSNSLSSIGKKDKKDNCLYSKYDFKQKNEPFYALAKGFVDKVNGLDYAIWSNVFRLTEVPFEKQKSFFCSQLVTAFFKFVHLLPQNIKTNRILPGHFSNEIGNKMKLPMKDCFLMKENLLLFKLPNINNAKHHRQ